MKQTKGPWEISAMSPVAKGKSRMIIVRAVNSPTNSSIVPVGGEDSPEVMANAHLIAAAPELLEALTDLVGGCGKEGDLFSGAGMDKARAAIAKAKGE